MEPLRCSRFAFGGVIGARLHANECNWLLKAPGANPGMLDMLAERDNGEHHDLVPWAGEFIGKYLISAVQALRLSDSEPLRESTARLIKRTIALQAEDGYLGPFPRAARLKANWDLWGHYHLIQALLLWYDDTADPAALKAAERIGELVCRTFLNTTIRVKDAGSAEMNMAVIHGLGLLYLRTHNPRLLAMMREIEIDWETSGKYVQTGLEGVPFYATPHPRWESLHDLQGLAVLYRITGDARYLQAFESHWRSILRWDVHNTGAFSTGEGAIGDEYTPGVVETCCTVAWMAVCVDYLELTGDPRAADALESALFNAVCGAQHPGGEWFTYDTPMDGVRVPSFSAVAFQARPNTPGLNCCSVNGPRGLTMLCDWAVTRSGKGLAINYYGPGSFQGWIGDCPDGVPISLEWQTAYPLNGDVKLIVRPDRPVHFPLLLRIPAWSRSTSVSITSETGSEVLSVQPGTYAAVEREWQPGDTVSLSFDMRVRIAPGDRAALGSVSVYQGPILLAYDSANNSTPAESMQPVSMKSLTSARLSQDAASSSGVTWLTAKIENGGPTSIYLTDFAGAGRTGSAYRSWLPVSGEPLPNPSLKAPDDGAMVKRGDISLCWSAPPPGIHELQYHVIVSARADLGAPIINHRCLNGTSYRITGTELRRLKPLTFYYWCVTIEGKRQTITESRFPARFRIAP